MLYLYSAYITITIRRRRRRKGADGGENRIRSSLRESTRIADIRAAERARITEESPDMGGRARIIGGHINKRAWPVAGRVEEL